MASNTPQLSIIAQYDDLCRHTKVITLGVEKEFKQFVNNQKRLQLKRKQAQVELEDLRSKVHALENENESSQTKINYLRVQLKNEIANNKVLEREKQAMELQITLIKDVLLNGGATIDNETKEKFFQLSSMCKQNKLATIEESCGSILGPSDCDESDEMDIAVTHRKRRSREKRSSGDVLQKRRKSEQKANLSFHDDFESDEMNTVPKRLSVNLRSSSDRPSDLPEIVVTPRPIHRSESENVPDFRKYNTVGYNRNTPTSGRLSFGGYSKKSHNLVTKTLIKSEKCYVCGEAVRFCRSVMRCSNCRVTCHPECQERLPEYCIYATSTPTRATGTISDYTPSKPPMIPPLIMHCVNQIDARGLGVVGLYRESGSKPQVNMLQDTFLKGKNVPSLVEYDVHVLCSTIKSFLRSLKDTLITKADWKKFVDAATIDDEDKSLKQVHRAVCELPQPNRDTLAYLILHLQRISESPECKMPVENIAKVLGPTIVGYSISDQAESNMLPETLNQTRFQYKVMERLLMIPPSAWEKFLKDDGDPFYTPMRTPECTPAPVTSRLGPILTSGSKSRNTTPVSRTPLKPRVTRAGSKTQKRQFFSPILK